MLLYDVKRRPCLFTMHFKREKKGLCSVLTLCSIHDTSETKIARFHFNLYTTDQTTPKKNFHVVIFQLNNVLVCV